MNILPNPYDLTGQILQAIREGYNDYGQTELRRALNGFQYGNLVDAFIDAQVERAASIEEGKRSGGTDITRNPYDPMDVFDERTRDLGGSASSNESGGNAGGEEEYDPLG